MGGLLVGVRLVERMRRTPLPQGPRGRLHHLGDGSVAVAGGGRHAVLVDVVAEVDHEVGVVGHDVRVGREEPVVVGLAGHGREGQLADVGIVGRCRLGASARGQVAGGLELVVVLAAGAQPLHLDVHRVGPPLVGECDAAGDDVPHPRVLGHPPSHRDPADAAHAPVRVERPWGQAGPQHDAGGVRIAAGDAERERVVETRWWGGRGGAGHADGEAERGGAPEEQATVEGGVGKGMALPTPAWHLISATP